MANGGGYSNVVERFPEDSDRNPGVMPNGGGDTGFNWGDMGKGIAKTGLPVLMSWLLNKGERDRKADVQKQQMLMAQELYKQMVQDTGVREPLSMALRGRMQQRQPRMLPGQVPMTNPYSNVQTMSRNFPPPQTQAQRVNQQMPSAGFTPQMLRERMRTQQFQGVPAMQDDLGEALKRQLIGRAPQETYDPETGVKTGFTG